MEKIKLFLRTKRLIPSLIIFCVSLFILTFAYYASQYLQRSAKLKLGSDTGLIISADRQDTLGAFTDTSFTLKSDQDLTVTALKKSLTFFPEIDFDIIEVNSRQFSITPKTPLEDNSVYRIKVLSEQKTFSWAFQTKNDFRVVQSLPRNRATYVPVNTGIEVTFSHDNWEAIGFKEGNFEITPPVEGRFERHKRTLSFVPKSLTPNTLYTIKVKKGLTLKGSSDILKNDFVFQFETQSPSGTPTLDFGNSFYEFSSTEAPALDITTSSYEGANLSVKVYQYPSSQSFLADFNVLLSFPSWARNSRHSNKLPVSGLNKVLEFSAPLQKQVYTNFFLFPQTLPKGFYLVESSSDNVSTQALIQITDLSAYLSVSGTKTIVWVNDIGSNTSVAGARILFAGKEETTGNDGVAYFDTPASELTDNKNPLIITSGNKQLILPQESTAYYYDSNYRNERRVTDKYWSYFYSDRPVYLPTDKVKFWGLLRDRDNLSQKQKLTLEVTRSDYTGWNFNPLTIYSAELETSDLGTFIGEIPLVNYNPGWYGISLKVGGSVVSSSSFSVETYTKPAYKITLSSSKNAAIVGETLSLSGLVSFFEGSPVPGMDLKFLSFGSEGGVTTDSLGRFSVNQIVPANSSNSYSPEYRYFSVRPALPEEGQIQADFSLPVFDSSLAFNQAKTQSNSGKVRVEIDLRQVNTEKFTAYSSFDKFSSAPNRTITGSLVENQWNRREVGTYYDFINKVTSPRYEYDRVQNKIADISLVTDANGKAVYEFMASTGKSYEINLQTVDDQGRITRQNIYASGQTGGYYPTNYVYLKTDKTDSSPGTYAIGEQVNLSVMRGDSPMDSSDSDKYLYLFAQRGLKSYQITDGGNISFRYSESFIPNVIVKAIRFTGKTYQVSESLNLNFNTQSKKLNLDITQDKASYIPGDTVKISVFSKDQTGLPASAEINVSFLDEAYSAMYSVSVDPLLRIYTSLSDDVLSSYQSHEYPIDASGAEGGGCFLAGTKIQLANGKVKNIEDIKVGDSITTLQDSLSGKKSIGQVSKVYQHQVVGYYVLNGHLRVTGEHNLYINGRWLTASEIQVGDSYLDASGRYQEITSIENYSGLNTVYNFTVDKLNTYLADGFYVHNDKGRELFVDNAYFGSVRTGLDGRASIEVKLPDNLTSWKIISQGITSDLKAGASSSLLAVKQPFFVDLVMNNDYLVEDKPRVIIRAYGEGLSLEDQINLRIQSGTLGLDKTITAKAFEASAIDLGELKEGKHQIIVSGSAKNLSDKLIREIKVVKSRLKITKTTNVALGLDTRPDGSPDSPTTLIFSDMSLGRFYPVLSNFAYTWGDRLDQRLARYLSQSMIQKIFDNTVTPESLNLSAFQSPEGGYSLFPYSEPDLELSVFIAALSKDQVDTIGLGNYFYKQFSQSKDLNTASMSLFGLASLDEPVLLLINNLSGEKDLTPIARLYLALAQAKIGDTEMSRLAYKKLLAEYSEKQDSLVFMKIGADKDDYLWATALTSALSSLLGEPESDGLLAYTLTNSGKDVLLVSPQLLAVSQQILNQKLEPVSFTYSLAGKKSSRKLERGETMKLELSPQELSSITFSDIEGRLGVTSTYLIPLDLNSAKVNDSVRLGRSYSVHGNQTNTFNPADLIKVSLPVSYGDITQDGCYQVSDLLPSGLKPITSVYGYGLDSNNVWYPYEINGQKVSFCISKGGKTNVINYYARVISAGEYRAENALIQSLISPSVYNLSPAGTISVR